MPKICDMGQTALLSTTKEGVLRIFFAQKNPKASAGFEPANLGTTEAALASVASVVYRVFHDFRA